jgi:hypothetical protein
MKSKKQPAPLDEEASESILIEEDEEEDLNLEEEYALSHWGSDDGPSESTNPASPSQDVAKCEKDWPSIDPDSHQGKFITEIAEKLKKELSSTRKVSCYENKTFWIHPPESLFMRQAKNNPAITYYDCLLPIYVWIPHLLCKVYCTKCGAPATNSTLSHGPIARLVAGFTNYCLITYEYEHKKCTMNGGKTKKFYGSSKACLERLDPQVAGCFRPILTKKGAIDSEFADYLEPSIMGGMGPAKISAALHEISVKRKDRKERNWIMGVNAKVTNNQQILNLLTSRVQSSVTDIPSYPEYSDRKTYNGFTPSANYLKGLCVHACLLLQVRDLPIDRNLLLED